MSDERRVRALGSEQAAFSFLLRVAGVAAAFVVVVLIVKAIA